MGPKDADGMANSVDPDRGAVWSGSTLFAQTCLSEKRKIITVKQFFGVSQFFTFLQYLPAILEFFIES